MNAKPDRIAFRSLANEDMRNLEIDDAVSSTTRC